MTRQDIMELEEGARIKFGDSGIMTFRYKDESYLYVTTSSGDKNKIPIIEFVRYGKAI